MLALLDLLVSVVRREDLLDSLEQVVGYDRLMRAWIIDPCEAHDAGVEFVVQEPADLRATQRPFTPVSPFPASTMRGSTRPSRRARRPWSRADLAGVVCQNRLGLAFAVDPDIQVDVDLPLFMIVYDIRHRLTGSIGGTWPWI